MCVHQPVFLDFIRENLIKNTDQYCVDATLGEGGHSECFLSLKKEVIAFERDPIILHHAQKRLLPYKKAIHYYRSNFSNMKTVLEKEKKKIDFALFDLGISMFHYKKSQRGFSFLKDEALDMRLSPSLKKTASDLINTSSKQLLGDIFYQYGEETRSRQIATHLVSLRKKSPIKTTFQLAQAICSLIPKKTKTHPATKVFQALRIKVNEELSFIEQALYQILDFLSIEARLAVISYHSLEDRIVKNVFKALLKSPVNENKYRSTKKEKVHYQLFFKKPVQASFQERQQNPSSRSAKMRVLLKV